jgi:hypothetical protein
MNNDLKALRLKVEEANSEHKKKQRSKAEAVAYGNEFIDDFSRRHL